MHSVLRVLSVCAACTLVAAGCATSVRGTELAREYHNIGNAYYDLGRYERAADYYQRALALDSRLAPAGYNLARVYIREGRYPDARAVLGDLLLMDPDNVLLRETLAYVHYLEDDIPRAAELYEQILALSPQNVNALFNLGRIAERQSDREEALAYYQRASLADETDPRLAYHYGRLLAERDPERAAAVLERYLDSSPRDFDRVVEAGDILRREAYFLSARRAYEMVPADHAERPRALFGRAAVYLVGIQDAEEGLRLLQEALDAGFFDPKEFSALQADRNLIAPQDVRAMLEQLEPVERQQSNGAGIIDGDA